MIVALNSVQILALHVGFDAGDRNLCPRLFARGNAPVSARSYRTLRDRACRHPGFCERGSDKTGERGNRGGHPAKSRRV